MPKSTMSSRRYFIAAAVICTSAAFCLIVALGVLIDRRFEFYGAIVPILAVVPGFVLTLACGLVLTLACRRKPFRSPNYPRIEHLRIAGKYSPTGSADFGISPLHLR